MATIAAMTPRQSGARERAGLTLMLPAPGLGSAWAIVTAAFCSTLNGVSTHLRLPRPNRPAVVVFSAGIKH